MKIIIALSTLFLLCTLAAGLNDTPSVDQMLEVGRKGVIQAIMNNIKPTPAAPEITLKKVYKMGYDRRIGAELYTFTADFKNSKLDLYRIGGEDASVCKVTFSVLHFEDGKIYFDRMKVEDLACRLLKNSDATLPWKFYSWIDA